LEGERSARNAVKQRKEEPKKNPKGRGKEAISPIEDALAEIELLRHAKGFSYKKIAAKYGVVRSTLA
jgi:hypothetical protein